MKKTCTGSTDPIASPADNNHLTGRGSPVSLALLFVSLAGITAAVEAAKPSATIQGVGFLCTEIVDCTVSTIRNAVEVQTPDGPVLLGVGASVNASGAPDPFPLYAAQPVLYSSAADELLPLPAVDANATIRTFLTASMITPDGLRIASRAQTEPSDPSRTAVIVDVNPGWPEFAKPTFTNTLLDPNFGNGRTAASNISDDGTVAYGFGTTGKFLWTAGSGLSPLALPAGTELGSGVMVGGTNASDGSRALVSGFNCNDAFSLCAQTGHVYNKGTDSFTALSPLSGDDSVGPFAMSASGEFGVGASYTSTLDSSVGFVEGQVVTWNLATGEPTAMGSPNTAWGISNFGGITSDGKAVIANFSDDSTQRSFLLNKHGIFSIEDVLTDAGVDLTDWFFSYDRNACKNCLAAGGTTVYGVSPDGLLIFGAALHEVDGIRIPEGFIVSGLRKNYLKNYKPKK